MDLELISFKLCPYVQRSVITLIHKDVPYRITHIDVADPPPWFLDISPFGKVPVLRVDDRTVIFESAVINEFIDETTPGRLHPEDPLQRALNRSWIEFGSGCIGDLIKLASTADEDAFEDTRYDLAEKFERLEQVLGNGPFFNGHRLSLVDAAFAPLFMRLEILNRYVPAYDRSAFPRTAAWSDALRGLPETRESVVPEFEDLYRAALRRRSGFLESRIPAA